MLITAKYNEVLNDLNQENDKLQKENAELKSEKGCEICTKFDEVKLIKAKVIIKSLLQSLYYREVEVELDKIDNSRIEQAEQFLKE